MIEGPENRPSRADDAHESRDLIGESHLVKFDEVDDASSVEFDEAMKIYIAAFPDNERRPVAVVKAMLNSGRSRLIVGRVGNESALAFMALLYPLTGTPFLLGDYLATAEGYRNKGIGKAFLGNIFDLIGDMRFKYFLVQVENPYIDHDEMKMRRTKFYKGLGMKELKGIRYILPPLQGTTPIELILMVLSTEDEDCLAGEILKAMIIQMFEELYDRHEGDEFLTLILGGIPDRVWLE